MDRIINFPEINWDKLKEGALSKEKVWEELKKGIGFVFEVRMLQNSKMLLRKETEDQAEKTLQSMRDLKEQYSQVYGIVQNIVGQEIRERAAENGDSKTLFARLNFLVDQAQFFGSITDWEEADLERVPFPLKKAFEVRLYDPRTKQTRHFLPSSWRNDTQKRTALVLRDLSFKARDTYNVERGKSKPETPLAPPAKVETETKINDFVPPPAKDELSADESNEEHKSKTPKKFKKNYDPKVGKKAKAVKDKDREKQDEKELQSVKSFSDIGKIVQ